MNKSGRLLVLYGSQTFTAQEIAERIWRNTKVFGFRGPVMAMDDYPISKLIHEDFVVFVCATTGQGDEPDNMKKFWKFLLRRNLPTNSLINLKFGVLGLGDSSYNKFNFVAKKLYKRLLQLGATSLLDIGLCDYQHDLGHDGVMVPWVKDFFLKLKQYFPNIQLGNFENKFIARWKVSLVKSKEENLDQMNTSKDIYIVKEQKDNLLNQTLLELHNNHRTTDESHFQDVRLLTFKVIGERLYHKPGDIFNIRPHNSKEDIDDLFDIFLKHDIDIKPCYRLLVEENDEDMPVPDFLKHTLTMYEIAEQYWDLRSYPMQYAFSLLAHVSEDELEKNKCIELSSPGGQEEWLNYCRRPRRTILEVLHDFHKSTSKLTIEVLFELFSPIKPRSFSIASSCLPSQGQRLEILVAVVKYLNKLKKPRLGLASNWLKSLNPGDRVYGWIKGGSFVFPEDEVTPYIMVGPGTGLAPFRSLLQDHIAKGQAHKEILHLLFGCRYENKDFHCRDELERWVEEDKLTLYCAFSREQDKKVYVQHKISEHKDTFWDLINEKKAHIYISGNAKSMPDNVKEAFIDDVISKAGKINPNEARLMLKNMENEGRLQVESW